MGYEKVEKKLPEDILMLIDQEASQKGMSRQEALAHLITAVKAVNLEGENKQLKRDIGHLTKQLEGNQKEIHYLRDEISTFSSGLTSLAVTLGEGRSNDEQIAKIDAMDRQLREMSSDIASMSELQHHEELSVIEKNLPMIMVSILSALLLIYVIIIKIG